MKPIIVCDEDDVFSDRMSVLVSLLNRVTGKQLGLDDMQDSRLWVPYGLTRDELNRIRQQVESTLDVTQLAPIAGALKAYDVLSQNFSFVIATARYTSELEATQEWHLRRGHDVSVELCACPDINCGSSRCAGREPKLRLAHKLDAHSVIDDHPGEFLLEGRPEAWGGIIPICFRQPWNQDCEGVVHRLSWGEITELLLH